MPREMSEFEDIFNVLKKDPVKDIKMISYPRPMTVYFYPWTRQHETAYIHNSNVTNWFNYYCYALFIYKDICLFNANVIWMCDECIELMTANFEGFITSHIY